MVSKNHPRGVCVLYGVRYHIGPNVFVHDKAESTFDMVYSTRYR